MPLGDDYITLAELKGRVSIPVSDTVDDTRLNAAIKAATEGINLATVRDFQKETAATARTYRPTRADLVITQDFHTITGLVVKTDEGDAGTFDTTLTSSAFELEPADGIGPDGQPGWPFWKIRLVDGTAFPAGRRRTVQVTAQWGWAAVPDSVKEAAGVLAEDIFKLKDAPFGAGGFAEYGRIRARENPNVANLIGNYRRVGSRLRVG